MTDEERQKLVAELRDYEGSYQSLHVIMEKAANEIERLTAELKEAKRHDMRDWHDALERGRKNPIIAGYDWPLYY